MKDRVIGEGLRYVIVGTLTTLINIIIYKALLILGSAYGIATTVAFIAAVVFAYIANGKYVFRAPLTRSGFVKFMTARLGTFAGETLGLVLLIELVAMDEFVSKLVVNIGVIIANYILSKFWIYKGVEGVDHENLD